MTMSVWPNAARISGGGQWTMDCAMGATMQDGTKLANNLYFGATISGTEQSMTFDIHITSLNFSVNGREHNCMLDLRITANANGRGSANN